MAIADRLERAIRDAAPMKLLIIDDEPAITETLETKFRKEGFSTFIADSAEEGMRLFKRVKPDLIILDIMLPNRSGFDLCKAIRKENATPIVFVSARADEPANRSRKSSSVGTLKSIRRPTKHLSTTL